MVGTSKILTVSYGTFSCTLEGFDESFNTMKAIAEYFRGLAADDRYFGAEPPTPDAEMLAQIAEREISRRVDAHMDDTGIHLRAAALTDQSKDQSDEAADAVENSPTHDDTSRAEVEAARKSAKAARKAEKKAARKAAKAEAKAAQEAEQETELAAAEAKAEADSTSILDSVSTATAEASDGSLGSEVEETRDDAPSSMLAAPDPAPENSPEESPEVSTDDAQADDDDDGAEAVADTTVPAHPDTQSVAAKLQRIRDVVSNKDAPGSDDLTEQFLPQADPQDVSDEVEVAPETAPETATPATDGSDMISRVMSRQSDGSEASEDTDSSEVEAEAPQAHARVVRMKRADFEKAVADSEQDVQAPAESQPEPMSSTGPDLGLLDGADELDDYLEDSDFIEDGMDFGDDAGLDADLVDDLKAIRDDLGDDLDDGIKDTIEVDDTPVSKAISDAMADQAPSEAESDTDDGDLEDDTTDNAFLAEDPQVDDAALDRLMSETDAQMKEPEGSRRRDAIEQLKAAVAAKEAARQAGETDDDDQDVENAFRNDLSEAVHPEGGAVRPRPVVRNPTRTERPRPAPLKLVAAQRIDLPATEPRDGPVVPRRVAARKSDAAQQSAGSFAEFAENMGASELPDLLEAAAAYTAFVEGADEFSRPQILRRVRAVASDDFNREDGLRSFADLLKSGRFTKVRNGRFQVADDSRFNPEQKAS